MTGENIPHPLWHPRTVSPGVLLKNGLMGPQKDFRGGVGGSRPTPPSGGSGSVNLDCSHLSGVSSIGLLPLIQPVG